MIDDKVGQAAQILKLEDFLDRRPKDLSGGQRQRVAIGRSIVRRPLLFFLMNHFQILMRLSCGNAFGVGKATSDFEDYYGLCNS